MARAPHPPDVTFPLRKPLRIRPFQQRDQVLSADPKSLAELESREVMLSKLAGLMKGEMSRAAAVFQATQARFLSLLEAFKAKLLEEPGAEAAPETAAHADAPQEAETSPESGETVEAPQAEEEPAGEPNGEGSAEEASTPEGPTQEGEE